MVKYNKIKGKVVEYMGIDGCLMLLFNYLIVVVTSCEIGRASCRERVLRLV